MALKKDFSDYDTLDKEYLKPQLRYRSCLRAAKNLGFDHVSGAIISLYFDKKETAKAISEKLNTPQHVWIYDFFRNTGLIARPKGPLIKKIYITDSFSELDKKIGFKYFDDKKKAAKKSGYLYITEAITDMYYNRTLPGEVVADSLDMTTSNVSYSLQRVNSVADLEDRQLIKFKDLDQIERFDFTSKLPSNPTWQDIRKQMVIDGIYVSPGEFKTILKEVRYHET